jgi:sorting nexin-8
MPNAGLSGNLTTGEILEQLVHADRLLAQEILARKEESKSDEENDSTMNNSKTNGKKKEKGIESVRNVVFMGMGEPLDNYANVTEACRTMIDRSMWNLAHGRVTVSTVGLISQIRRLTKELPEVSLALSLHAPNQKDREDIVPTASRYPIEGLIDALDNHMMAYLDQKRKRESWKKKPLEAADGGIPEEQRRLQIYTAEERIKESSRRRAMIEYVMLKGESSSFKCAHELGKLCENRHLVVNLIPYNATDVKDKLQCPSDEHMLEFRNIVQSYGTFVTIRRTMGADIASACGQLVQKKNKEQDEKEALKKQSKVDKDHGGREKAIDIEDVVVGRSENTNKSYKETVANTDTVTSKAPQKVEISEQKQDNDSRSSWTESLSNNDLDRCFRILTLATTVSASCFLASSALFLKRKRY